MPYLTGQIAMPFLRHKLLLEALYFWQIDSLSW